MRSHGTHQRWWLIFTLRCFILTSIGGAESNNIKKHSGKAGETFNNQGRIFVCLEEVRTLSGCDTVFTIASNAHCLPG